MTEKQPLVLAKEKQKTKHGWNLDVDFSFTTNGEKL
jgi:hypothetical protein